MKINWKWLLLAAAVVAISFLIKNPYYDASHDDNILTEITVEKAREASVQLREAYKDTNIYMNGIKEPYDKTRTEYAHAKGMVDDLEPGNRKTRLGKQLNSVEQEIAFANTFNSAVRAGKLILAAQQHAEETHLKEPLDIKEAVRSQKELLDTIKKHSDIFNDIPFAYTKKDMRNTYLNPAKQFNREAIIYVEALALLDEARQAEQNELTEEKERFIAQAEKKASRIKHEELKAKLDQQINELRG
jgi:hypothetical protein